MHPGHASLTIFSLALLSIVSGTSASSPVLAGMVALVNAARIADGKSPLGRYFVAVFDAFGLKESKMVNSNTFLCVLTSFLFLFYTSFLGWINPMLYQLYEAFAIDITEGK